MTGMKNIVQCTYVGTVGYGVSHFLKRFTLLKTLLVRRDREQARAVLFSRAEDCRSASLSHQFSRASLLQI